MDGGWVSEGDGLGLRMGVNGPRKDWLPAGGWGDAGESMLMLLDPNAADPGAPNAKAPAPETTALDGRCVPCNPSPETA